MLVVQQSFLIITLFLWIIGLHKYILMFHKEKSMFWNVHDKMSHHHWCNIGQRFQCLTNYSLHSTYIHIYTFIGWIRSANILCMFLALASFSGGFWTVGMKMVPLQPLQQCSTKFWRHRQMMSLENTQHVVLEEMNKQHIFRLIWRTCWKKQVITKVMRIHCLGTMDL